MISFMIIGAPRSGTAWAANWLTTEKTLCLHDPLFQHDLDALDRIPAADRIFGIADTGIVMFSSFLQHHPAKKVILHREQREVERSLQHAGFTELVHRDWGRDLQQVDGLYVDWRALFDAPRVIHRYLFGNSIPFDAARHALLMKLNVQMDFDKVDPDPEACRRMIERMRVDVR